MEVLVVGLPRTGTQSMKIALEQLYPGRKVLHLPVPGPTEPLLWIKAIEAKFGGKGKPFEDWDAVLGNYVVRLKGQWQLA
jgi:hypothetical protein